MGAAIVGSIFLGIINAIIRPILINTDSALEHNISGPVYLCDKWTYAMDNPYYNKRDLICIVLVGNMCDSLINYQFHNKLFCRR